MRKVMGGQIIAEMLAAEGVDTVFGIIDGTYMGIQASFEKYQIRLISPRHETSAAHMAGAYSRMTGKLGVCMASNGPGVANILPGVAVENAEGHRVLLLTSSRRSGIAYPDRGGTYQCFDQVGVISKMAKYSAVASDFSRIPEIFRHAMRAAYSGRPGLVHIDVPENVLNGTYEIAREDQRTPAQYRNVGRLQPDPDGLDRAAALLRDAKFPLIHAGTGVMHAEAYSELCTLAETLGAAVTTSWSATASMPCRHPLRIPTAALDAAKLARNEADVVLVVGSRVGETDWWGKAPYWARDQQVIQIDIDETVLGANKPAELCLMADAKLAMAGLIERLKAQGSSEAIISARRETLSKIAETRDTLLEALNSVLVHRGNPMHPAHVPTTCREFFPADAICVVDGGNTAVWTNFYHSTKAPNTLLSTFKFGMLGAGVPQALGAKAAHPDKQVYCIIGDGAMGFHLQEIETAVRHELPLTVVVLCDKQWGMVKTTQSFALGQVRKVIGVESKQPTFNADFSEIAFDQVAIAMGAHGERVSEVEQLRPALERATASGKPAVIHVDVDPMLHMMAPGLMEFKAMHQEPEG
ncbi:MAG: thiamine pyrophosphate-binding protein [Deltaproteobacteria bacterium]|nr:thiamine pyrophosphate-binding protein [Deltaproteobacteria bacterium]